MIVSSRNSIRKIAKLKKRLESVLIDEAEYPFLKIQNKERYINIVEKKLEKLNLLWNGQVNF